MTERDHQACESQRHMVEEITVTPFFKRHRKHMPATLKLKAQIRDDPEWVILETSIAGYKEEDVEVSATPNTIDIRLVLEKNEESCLNFHNSYFTPSPIDPSRLSFEHKNEKLIVKARKR